MIYVLFPFCRFLINIAFDSEMKPCSARPAAAGLSAASFDRLSEFFNLLQPKLPLCSFRMMMDAAF